MSEQQSPSPWLYPDDGDPMPEEGQVILYHLKFKDGQVTEVPRIERYYESVCKYRSQFYCWMPMPKTKAESES